MSLKIRVFGNKKPRFKIVVADTNVTKKFVI